MSGRSTGHETGPAGVLQYDTAYGAGWIAFDADGGVTELGLPGAPVPGAGSDPPPAIRSLSEALTSYWGGGPLPRAGPEMIGRAAATPFLRRVYEIVAEIPRRKTLTYAEIAELAGRPGAARAVGAAMARNPFAPLIPCHRVVGSDGRLTGYGGGLDMKRRLLEMEGVDA
jgi:methylated-DNA-[protein]-cysteine S-methyltransferase